MGEILLHIIATIVNAIWGVRVDCNDELTSELVIVQIQFYKILELSNSLWQCCIKAAGWCVVTKEWNAIV